MPAQEEKSYIEEIYLHIRLQVQLTRDFLEYKVGVVLCHGVGSASAALVCETVSWEDWNVFLTEYRESTTDRLEMVMEVVI